MPRVNSLLYLLFLPFVLLSGLLQAEALKQTEQWWREGGAGEGGDVAILRSPNDDRQYRYIQLDNQMKVLLVADSTAEKSAASLNVHVGSFQNPAEREGLAHFLEHMLFLGTEKYPEAGAYQAFISEHGGEHNAYTSLEQTNYFFNVDSAYLMDALDRFAQFFVAPRFDAQYVDRERHAVESEYRLKIKDDSRREWDVLAELLNPRHPLGKFSVGNLETLVNDESKPIRKDLLAFYQTYYSANLMTLVVLGKESLDQLEAAVRMRFSAVRNHNTLVEVSGQALFAGDLPAEVLIKPEKEKRELSLLFPLPSVKPYWQQKPMLLLGHLLGDESEGSFLAVLKAQGLIETLSAGQAFDTREGAAFSVTIGLTPQGVAMRHQVLDLFYQWLALVIGQGIESWRYDELSRLQQSAFRFIEKSSPSSYVQNLSVALHDYPPREVVRGDYLLEGFDQALIQRMAKYLRPENALVSWVAPELFDTDATDSTRLSQHYGAPYRLIARDDLAKKVESHALASQLRLPKVNPFLPSAFPLSGKGGSAAKPVKLQGTKDKSSSTPWTLWYYADTQFGSPRANFSARLALPVLSSCQQEAQSDLYLGLVQDQLDASLYPARLSGLAYGLSRWDNGIVLNISGYADKQPVLLTQVLTVMASPDWSETRFKRVREQLIREGRNSLKEWPIRQVFAELDPLLRGSCRPIELAEQLESVGLAELKTFSAKLFARGHAQFYAGGVLSRQSAEAMVAATLEGLRLGSKGDEALSYKVLKLPSGAQTALREIPVDHSDSSVALYIQGAEDSLRERAHLALLQGMMDAPFYSEMRTEKKLGYVVGSDIAHRRRVPGLVFYVQSPVATAQQLRGEVDGFLSRFEAVLADMNEGDLERYRRSVLVNIEEAPKSLGELSARHRESIELGFDSVEFRPLLAEQLRAVTRESLLDAYQRLFKGDRRALWLGTLDNGGRVDRAQGVDRRALKASSGGSYEYED